MTTDRYPRAERVFFGRRVWPLGECGEEGALVEGHGRRAVAAISAHEREMRGYPGWARIDGWPGAEELWVRIHETCGCTEEEHATHLVCQCVHFGAPPCREEFAWAYDRVGEGQSGAVAVTRVRW